MNVAFLTELFPKLSETFILNQITGLIDDGHSVRVFATRAADEPKTHSEIDEYSLIERTTYTNKPDTYLNAISRMLRTIQRHPQTIPTVASSLSRGKNGIARIANIDTFLNSEPNSVDIYHAHFGNVAKSWDFLCGTSAVPEILTQSPFIVSFYGEDASYILQEDPNAYDQLFKQCDIVTVLSEDMKSELTSVGCPENKIEIQPLGVNVEKFRFRKRTPSDDGIDLLTVARFDKKKGLEYAVDAVAPLVKQYNVTYRIAGNGPLFDEIKDQVDAHGIADSVELLGWVDQNEVRELYNKSDVFLLPSVTADDGNKEGTPTVLLEAQACGLPIVSTYHAGIPEIVEDESSGLLVPEREVNSLRDALEEMFNSPENWSKMGTEGRKFVERRHSTDAVVSGLSEIYTKAKNDI